MRKTRVKIGKIFGIICLGCETKSGSMYVDYSALANQIKLEEKRFKKIIIEQFNAKYLQYDKTLEDNFILGFLNEVDAYRALEWYSSQLIAVKLRGEFIWFYV